MPFKLCFVRLAVLVTNVCLIVGATCITLLSVVNRSVTRLVERSQSVCDPEIRLMSRDG